jgi:site-specific DNA-methyltransferase (adenine-specific)
MHMIKDFFNGHLPNKSPRAPRSGDAMKDIWKSPCGLMELRLGKWQDVLADIKEVDAVITDPPYSERTHKGMRSGSDAGLDGCRCESRIGYQYITIEDIQLAVDDIIKLAPEWTIVFCDHGAWPVWEQVLSKHNQYTFGPVAWVKPNTPRFGGDGPSLTTEWLCVSRPKKRVKKFSSRPGHYLVEGNMAEDKKGSSFVGQKPLNGMRALVKNYSEPNDLVYDPYAGSGTTLLAAAIEGRRAIGAEMDPKTFKLAVKRLSKGYTPNMFAGKERWGSGLTGELL